MTVQQSYLLCWELLPDRNCISMGLWYWELMSRPDPAVLTVGTLHSLEWFWVSRRIFIYSHHDAFVFSLRRPTVSTKKHRCKWRIFFKFCTQVCLGVPSINLLFVLSYLIKYAHNCIISDFNIFGIHRVIFTRGQFWPSGIVVACVCLSVCVSVFVCVRQPRACPRHKSRRVQARTTKFGQKVQNNLVKVPIVLGGDWPWPSRSNLTWKAKFTPFWACPRHNS